MGFSGLARATVWFNSVVGSKGYGVIMAQADQVDFRNNLLAYSDTHGMSADDGRFSEYSTGTPVAASGRCGGAVTPQFLGVVSAGLTLRGPVVVELDALGLRDLRALDHRLRW